MLSHAPIALPRIGVAAVAIGTRCATRVRTRVPRAAASAFVSQPGKMGVLEKMREMRKNKFLERHSKVYTTGDFATSRPPVLHWMIKQPIRDNYTQQSEQSGHCAPSTRQSFIIEFPTLTSHACLCKQPVRRKNG